MTENNNLTERPSDPREHVSQAVNRTLVIAEAKLLVHRLDDYLKLIAEWEEREGGIANAQ